MKKPGETFSPNTQNAIQNKIGLTVNGQYITDARQVVLDFPHKDRVLENGTFASGEIDKLFEPKVLTNCKKFDVNGEHRASPLKTTDNLVIRGNNLVVLHSLKAKYKGKIKLIYIDPPYNTGSDSFRYNDNFDQSTWLTFIKNRIEVAKDLMGQEGFLFLHISSHHFAYLKVLLDELFNGQHVCTFNLLVRHPNRILKGDKDFHDVVEYLLVYTKNKIANKIAKRVEAANIDRYVYQVKELNKGQVAKINGSEITFFKPGDYKILKGSPSAGNLQKISIRGSLKEGNSSGRFYEKYLAPVKSGFPPNTLFKIPNMGNDRFDHRYFYTPEEGKRNGGYFQGVPKDGKGFREKPYPNFLDFVKDFNNVGYEGGVEFRNGKKPEALLRKVFEIGKVKKGDIVLDFFLGSGTTAVVAHKLGVQYIGIEQRDYGKDDSVRRLNGVIKGEKGGISEIVGWAGGGSFVYCEVVKLNSRLTEIINKADKEDDVNDLFEFIIGKKSPGRAPGLPDASLDKNYFSALSFEDKKKLLLEVLDKNQLYLNYSEMENEYFPVPEVEKQFNHDFYQPGKTSGS